MYNTHVLHTFYILHTSPQSPEINPIEHLWTEKIGKRLKNSKMYLTSKNVLKQKILEVWNSIQSTTTKLVPSIQHRLKLIIEAKRDPIKY